MSTTRIYDNKEIFEKLELTLEQREYLKEAYLMIASDESGVDNAPNLHVIAHNKHIFKSYYFGDCLQSAIDMMIYSNLDSHYNPFKYSRNKEAKCNK